MDTDDTESSALRDNLNKSFLAAYETLQFSKENKSDAEVADIERRCLFMKYTMCNLKYAQFNLCVYNFKSLRI